MVFILIKYIKLLKALASSVFNDKILAFSTPNTEKLTTSHVQNAKIFGMDEQYHSTKQYGKNTKILVFFFFLIQLSFLFCHLSLSLSCCFSSSLTLFLTLIATDLTTMLLTSSCCLDLSFTLSPFTLSLLALYFSFDSLSLSLLATG